MCKHRLVKNKTQVASTFHKIFLYIEVVLGVKFRLFGTAGLVRSHCQTLEGIISQLFGRQPQIKHYFHLTIIIQQSSFGYNEAASQTFS